MWVVTTGMGSASTAIVLPEVVCCGAKRLYRVGSAHSFGPAKPGEIHSYLNKERGGVILISEKLGAD